jgi:hypothetical protein
MTSKRCGPQICPHANAKSCLFSTLRARSLHEGRARPVSLVILGALVVNRFDLLAGQGMSAFALNREAAQCARARGGTATEACTGRPGPSSGSFNRQSDSYQGVGLSDFAAKNRGGRRAWCSSATRPSTTGRAVLNRALSATVMRALRAAELARKARFGGRIERIAIPAPGNGPPDQRV